MRELAEFPNFGGFDPHPKIGDGEPTLLSGGRPSLIPEAQFDPKNHWIEVELPTNINWATNVYDDRGAFAEAESGIKLIGIGPNLYRLKAGPREKPVSLYLQETEAPSYFTEIGVGTLAQHHKIVVVANNRVPFSFEDPKRINDSAKFAMDFEDTLKAFQARGDVLTTSMKFIEALKVAGKAADIKILGDIAVLQDSLMAGLKLTKPQLLTFAKVMQDLQLIGLNFGSANIPPLDSSEHMDFYQQYTSRSIRVVADEVDAELNMQLKRLELALKR